MSLRPSKALRNALLEGFSLKRALSNCCIKIYTGAQPSTAEAAPTGTLLCTVSKASGAMTREVLAQGKIVLSGTTAGSLDTLTVNSHSIITGAIAYDTSFSVTCDNIVTNINNNPKNYLCTASKSGSDTVILTALPGIGVVTWAVASGETTMTVTDTAFGSVTAGVAPVNMLTWGDAAAGVLVKNPSETWSGVNAASGTAGWFRIEAAVSDPGTLDSSESIIRLDGSISTSGADMNLSNTVFTSGATFTLSSASITLPTA